MKTSYFLHYYWHHYNTGAADNYDKWSRREFEKAEDAIRERNKIIEFLKKDREDFVATDSPEDLNKTYFDGDGFFLTHMPYITKETVTVEKID